MKMILIVEDEYGNAEILQLLLEAEGYKVVMASNGKQAMEFLRDGEKPSLILSDFMMPIMNGGEFGQIVSQDESLNQIPFVFMSATSEEIVRRLFTGYDAFLVKPIELDTLLRLVGSLISCSRPPRTSPGQVDESVRHLLQGIRMPASD